MRWFGGHRAHREEGYTLVEVVLAMFVVVTVMVALLGVLVSSLSTIAQARQRQTATALATRAIETLRALPYDEITVSHGAAPDPALEYVVEDGGRYYFQPGDLLPETGEDGELLVVTARGTKREAITTDGVTYVIQNYVTQPSATTAGEQFFNLTVLVSWTSSVSPQGRTTAQRSVAYSPSGCLSTAQSPFAAPCQAYFTAQAGQAAAGIVISNPDDSSLPIEGFDAADPDRGKLLELSLATFGTSLLLEQTASGSATATTSGSRRVEQNPVPEDVVTSSGAKAASVAVDSDPSSGDIHYSGYELVPSPANVSLPVSGEAGTLTVTGSTSDSGRVDAAIEADTSQCSNSDGNGLVTGPDGKRRPCASARIRPDGTAGVRYQPASAFGFSSLDIPLVRVGTTGADFRSVSAQLAAVNTDACSAGAGPGAIGCSYGAAYRQLGTVNIGLTATGGVAPDGWDHGIGLVQVTGLTETARSEEGMGARSPAYQRTGTLLIWNEETGSYDSVPLSLYSDPPGGGTSASHTWPVGPTTHTYDSPSGTQLTLTFEGSVTVQRPQVQYTPATRTGNLDADCQDEACVSQVNGGGAVIVNITVTILEIKTGTTTQKGRFAIAGNLGGLIAQATYKAAPDVE